MSIETVFVVGFIVVVCFIVDAHQGFYLPDGMGFVDEGGLNHG